ncbi:13116_t:CDS:2 [Funneliformis geosporum]|uniref:17484_t:CDS:1 n=1 Tax=Funneliformis geosporum TaxID=1117311 RepID=A0A9W4SYM3_9GLOM|nr:13116_t:CDS:2 [Funneliformis geosporum]CAI2186190.1 17484_t:CDS:2 [Funneliformis geosporum]
MESTGLFHDNFDKMYQGSFSYKNNNSNTVVIDHNNKAILENIDPTIARIYFVNSGGNHIQIPNNMTFRDVTNSNNVPHTIVNENQKQQVIKKMRSGASPVNSSTIPTTNHANSNDDVDSVEASLTRVSIEDTNTNDNSNI